MPRGLSLNRMPEQMPEFETHEEMVERILQKVKELKRDERLKREEAEHKTKGLRRADLEVADLIRAIYIDLEERLGRESPSLRLKKRAPLKQRIIKGRVSKRKNLNRASANSIHAKTPTKTLKERKEDARREFFKQQSRAKRELKEMVDNPQAFEKKMERLEQEELEAALSGAYGNFHRDLPPPGHTRPIQVYTPAPAVPTLMPFKAMSDPGPKKIMRSLSKRAKSANQVSKRTPEWARRKKARPDPVRTRKSRPKRTSQFTQ